MQKMSRMVNCYLSNTMNSRYNHDGNFPLPASLFKIEKKTENALQNLKEKMSIKNRRNGNSRRGRSGSIPSIAPAQT